MPVSKGVTRKNSSGQDVRTLPINEIFYSLQGEGKRVGEPSIFIRTSGCNLRCWFCDSYHTSWEPTHANMSIQDIVDEVKSYSEASNVVLTGGEPLMHKESVSLLEELSNHGFHTTVETNGTVYREAPIDLVSISPKLASSTPTEDRAPTGHGEWADRHEERRINLDSIIGLLDNYSCQLKFVVTGKDDMPEITQLIGEIRDRNPDSISDSDVLLMPEGATQEKIKSIRNNVAELAKDYRYRYTPRLHVNLWDDAPET